MMHRVWALVAVLVSVACGASRPHAAPVRPGIEVLLSDSLHLVEGRRVGLLTNQTGVDRAGRSDVERLLEAGVQLTTIFSPEHGYRGVLDDADIGHGADSATGLPVYSLYGNVNAPTSDMLEDVDVLVVDLHDVGARPYTFISTTLLTMRSAAAAGVLVVVLDRPNPIGGTLVQGPMLDMTYASFVGSIPVPLRHGMTLGEMARFGNAVLEIGADLTVVPTAGWRRHQWFDETGLPWIRPSPSMPDLESATHYPGTVLFEATNLSVGRGTAVAFQVLGAPWLDAAALVRTIGVLPGVDCADTIITPRAPPDGKYDGVAIPAVRLRVTDRHVYDPTATALVVLQALAGLHGDSLRVNERRMAQLAGSEAFWTAARDGRDARAVVAGWAAAAAAFEVQAAPHQLYR